MQFAKELHYPTPVTSFNAKLMRKLVENGPQNYPGNDPVPMSYMFIAVYFPNDITFHAPL